MVDIRIFELVDIFAELSQSQLAKIGALCKDVNCEPDQVVFAENSPSSELYIIIEGTIDIRIDPDLIGSGEHHQPATIATLRKGQSFGEIALVDEGQRSASAHAGEQGAHLLSIARADLTDLMRADKEIGFVVMSNLATDLCLKIRQTNLLMREKLLYGIRE